MDQEDKERLERAAEDHLNKRFGEGVVRKVEVLQYGDEVMVRVILNSADELPHETLHAFEKAHHETIEELRAMVAEKMPFIARIQFTVGPPDRTAVGRGLTPVMARLDPKDVETLDALITAGIVSNRAEGVRWALARIRERPAYAQLREHIGKIDELKAQF